MKPTVTSRFTIFMIIIWVFSPLFGLFICFSTLSSVFTPSDKYLIFGMGATYFPILLLAMWVHARRVTIDGEAQTILFRNLVSRKEELYSFAEWEGFVEVFVSTKGGKVKVLYLIRAGKFHKKLSGSIYSNLDELQRALAPIKYLGVEKLNATKSVKILFGKPIIKDSRRQNTSHLPFN